MVGEFQSDCTKPEHIFATVGRFIRGCGPHLLQGAGGGGRAGKGVLWEPLNEEAVLGLPGGSNSLSLLIRKAAPLPTVNFPPLPVSSLILTSFLLALLLVFFIPLPLSP